MLKNQEERLEYLIDELCLESSACKHLEEMRSEPEKLLRSLMNIRTSKPISEKFLKIQDRYLKCAAEEKGIVTLSEIPTIQEFYNSNIEFADRISLWKGDITRLHVDAIVNAANSQMLGCFIPCHKCIDNAIHSAAGIQLRDACHQYMTEKRKEDPTYEEPTGSAVITEGFNLPSKYVIHTVGPIVSWHLTEDLKQDLMHCYESCLKVALENNIKSIAFCCISTGEFHFPSDEAAIIAIKSVQSFLEKDPDKIERIIFNVFKDQDLEIYKGLLCK
ncbi:protein-ADP-ribose hydrolase [Clostridium aminobutyricum]|uniref:Protein-ADP-ribose hydrolase n=1 Tax=Clostridium aminobutyricum TaxID=33953 RepID=A0A939DA13_CLOAM|nr:protein-ADP-ribose hydrolase [Clostridium aminobutyricum]MBN7773513.1 protein-ADP-ribose hydrolase [Clostridium aminobutyricum]